MSAPAITLHPYNGNDRPLLRGMELLYSHDFSEITTLSFKESGYFLTEAQFDEYFINVFATLIIRVDGKPAGFAIIDNKSQLDGASDVHDVLQFFILRGMRKRGIGKLAARAVFDRYPGKWEVRQIDENAAAQVFWRRAISEYTGGNFAERRWEDEDGGGVVQTFHTPSHTA
ncbi:GNAT family N-acetyltransferase [Chitinimonas sp. BJYL2]|uniref:GNAT family N-acetyltransferase n=1 Tax=Chitinimonas sp. BJYL2 TaxID=2976696 RepID=UPI0022B55E78|nr:GNAT family N-acetyltransferase [Chitinimonas sp. BJYL2]